MSLDLVPVSFADACAFVADFRRLVTYTQQGESGASLRAAGWSVIAERPPRPGWNMPSRPREPKGTENVQRYLWEQSEKGAA